MAVSKPNNPQARPVPPRPIPTPAPAPAAKKRELKPLEPLFVKENYIWMAAGAVIVALGMLLMSGGKNIDPNTFDKDVVYSFRRITIAPILIVAGLLVEVYALFKKPKAAAKTIAE